MYLPGNAEGRCSRAQPGGREGRTGEPAEEGFRAGWGTAR